MKKKIAILSLLFTAVLISFYCYIYQGERNIAGEKSVCLVSLTNLQLDFMNNDVVANEKYLDKTINVKGKITSIDFENHTLEIDEKILAVFKETMHKGFALNQPITLKGRYIGYDDLFDQYRLDQVLVAK